MRQSTSVRASDTQVFLIMGCSDEGSETRVAIVMAENLERAKQVFSRSFKGVVPLSYPCLKEIKQAAAWMEDARNGGFAAQTIVIDDMAR